MITTPTATAGILLAALISGCINTKEYGRGYDGPELPASAVATIRAGKGLTLQNSVDGKVHHGGLVLKGWYDPAYFQQQADEINALGLRVLPVKHTILLWWSDPSRSTDPVHFTGDFVAGHAYIVEGEVTAWNPGTGSLVRLTLRDTTIPPN